MLKSLWRRLSPSGAGATAERDLARYYRDEGLHAELELLHAQRVSEYPRCERSIHATRAYFSA